MSNREISRLIKEFQKVRQEWIDKLVSNPRSTAAAEHIVSINHKIELLSSLWNWSDETIDFPY